MVAALVPLAALLGDDEVAVGIAEQQVGDPLPLFAGWTWKAFT
jgi:hypothetical protein